MNQSSDFEEQQAPRTVSSIPPPSLGRTEVGRYDIIYPIAQGGMASVYAGRLPGIAGFEKLVAIKVIHPHLSNERSFVNMFLDEARLAAGIHHPNVGEVYEVGEDSGLFFMASELILGQSLRALYRRARLMNEKISDPVAAEITAKVCSGLHAAHELKNNEGSSLNLVHRDVSPRNILLSYDGFVKLIDFGVAWAQERISHTDVGTIKGKIAFMPPEQIRGRMLDRRSDLFSLGVVLYGMLTGEHPFPGSSEAERMHKILHGDFKPPRLLRPEIDPRLERFLLTALANNPDNRFSTGAEAKQVLDEYTRNCGQPCDAEAIAELMQKLFADERHAHEERMRAYRKTKDDLSSSVRMTRPGSKTLRGVGIGNYGQGEPADMVEGSTVTAPAAEDPARLTAWRSTARIRRRRTQTLIAMAAGVAVAVLMLVVLFTRPGSGEQMSSGNGQPSKVSQGETPDPKNTKFESPEIKTIKVNLDISPADAAITLDGRALVPGTTSVSLPRDSGRHTMEFYAEGYVKAKEIVEADGDHNVTVRLEKAAPAKPVKTGDRGGRKTGPRGGTGTKQPGTKTPGLPKPDPTPKEGLQLKKDPYG